ncbi:MAG: hypothetical protein IPL46_16500 [Saprospiraceae bacterium]|nr:hypothetical protein [Saprospiraceae bacterium]
MSGHTFYTIGVTFDSFNENFFQVNMGDNWTDTEIVADKTYALSDSRTAFGLHTNQVLLPCLLIISMLTGGAVSCEILDRCMFLPVGQVLLP